MSVSDNFNRADGGPPLSGTWTDVSNVGTISSNQLVIVSPGGQFQWTANSWTAEQDVTITAVNSSIGSASHQMWERSDATFQNAYLALIDGTPNLRCGVVVGGSTNWLLVGNSVANNDLIRFSVTGSTLNIFINGVQQGAGAGDSTYSAAGIVGIGGITGTIIDDFLATGEIPATGDTGVWLWRA